MSANYQINPSDPLQITARRVISVDYVPEDGKFRIAFDDGTQKFESPIGVPKIGDYHLVRKFPSNEHHAFLPEYSDPARFEKMFSPMGGDKA